MIHSQCAPSVLKLPAVLEMPSVNNESLGGILPCGRYQSALSIADEPEEQMFLVPRERGGGAQPQEKMAELRRCEEP